MTEKKKDIVVIAREGYQVLLNIGSSNFQITSYEPVNLSKLFDEETLSKCTSLTTHLDDGNLVYFKGQSLPKDPQSVQINAMRQVTETKLETTYDQAELTAAANVQLNTTADKVTPELKNDIQARVVKNREEILANDKKLLEKKISTSDTTRAKERTTSLSKDELTMKVSMDVSPEKFAEIQKDSRKKLQGQIDSDNERAAQEVADLQKNEQKQQQENE